MASRLLGSKELSNLAASTNLSELIGKLIRTTYRKSVEAAILRGSDLASVGIALKQDLKHTFVKIRTFFTEEDRKLYNLVVRNYDIQNIKSILRGVARQIPTSEIEDVLFPIAKLNEGILTKLAQSSATREVIDHLASLGVEMAAPLIALRSQTPYPELFWMEIALDQWYFRQGFADIKSYPNAEPILRDTIITEADVANIMTILRVVASSRDLKSILHPSQLSIDQDLFVGPGNIAFKQLNLALEELSLDAAIDHFKDTVYYSSLKLGTNYYNKTGLLSDIEKPLRLFKNKRRHLWYVRDPLGIGVLLGYIALKSTEVSNLRWIAHGIHFGLGEEMIRAELELLR